jgi:isopenicillin-N N-acyltransferase like protein
MDPHQPAQTVPAAETPAFPLIEAAGPPREMGRQYGRAAAERIHRSVAIYQRGFAEKGVEWPLAREIAERFAPRIEQRYPRIAEEMHGIADGAEIAYADVVAINARTELLYGGFGTGAVLPDEDMDGCTAAVALPGVTASGHLLQAQNWDWRDECADSSIVLKLAPDDGPRMLIFVEAGLMARIGFNDAGIAITGNFLECEHDGKRSGVPVPVVRRQVLTHSSLGPALQTVLTAERAFSINLLLSHRDGEAVDLECTPDEVFWLLPEQDVLTHANHFVSLAARVKLRDTGVVTNADSLYRDVRVRRYLERDRGRITVKTLQEALADRFGAPRSVCRAATVGPGGKVSSTVATVIMDTTAQRMWVAPRPYGPHRYVEYGLD